MGNDKMVSLQKIIEIVHDQEDVCTGMARLFEDKDTLGSIDHLRSLEYSAGAYRLSILRYILYREFGE